MGTTTSTTFHHTTADSESLLSSTASSSRRIFQPFGSLHYSTQSAFKMSWQAYVDSRYVFTSSTQTSKNGYATRDYTLEVKDMSSQRLKTEVFTPERAERASS